MTDENPYAAPAADGESARLLEPEPQGFGAIARPTFLAWERLRVAYVAMLGLLTIGICGSTILVPSVLMSILVGAVFANIGFFAGPAVESYARWLGYKGQWLRLFLFTGGTTLTALLAIASLATMPAPP